MDTFLLLFHYYLMERKHGCQATKEAQWEEEDETRSKRLEAQDGKMSDHVCIKVLGPQQLIRFVA